MIGKFFKFIVGTILVAAFLFGFLVIFTFLPIPGNYKFLTVLSGSMEPTISTGSVVFVKSSNEYFVNDVVTRLNGNDDIPITHRIVSQSEESGTVFFQTQGDANNVVDTEQVTADTIIGKVIFDVPYMGYMVNFARTTQGLVLFIIIPASILVFEEMKNIKKELSRMAADRKREKTRTRDEDDLMTAEMCASFLDPSTIQSRSKPKKVIKIV